MSSQTIVPGGAYYRLYKDEARKRELIGMERGYSVEKSWKLLCLISRSDTQALRLYITRSHLSDLVAYKSKKTYPSHSENIPSNMASWGPGHIELVTLGVDSDILQKRFLNGAWSAWKSLGGYFVYQPVPISIRPNSVAIFAIGIDGKCYAKWCEDGQWNPSMKGSWQDVGAMGPNKEFMERPTVVRSGFNKLDLFGIDKHRALWKNHYNGSSWSGFVSLGGTHSHAPSVVSTGDNKLDIFAIGSDNGVYHKWFDGSVWGPAGAEGRYESLNFKALGEVRAVTRPGDPAGIIDLFAVGWDSAIWYKTGPRVSSNWRSLDWVSRGVPSVVALDTTSLHVYITGPDSNINHLFSHDGGATWAEEDMGGPLIFDVTAVSWGQDHMSTLGVTINRNVIHKIYVTGKWWKPSFTTFEDLGEHAAGVVGYK